MAHCCGAPSIFKGGFRGAPEAGNASASTDPVGGVITDPSGASSTGVCREHRAAQAAGQACCLHIGQGWLRPGSPQQAGVLVLALVRPSVSQSASLNGAAMSALAVCDRALQARPLAGVTVQGTEALEAAPSREQLGIAESYEC